MSPDEIRAIYDQLPDDWELVRTSDLVRAGEEREREWKNMRETIGRWRDRAERAEATIDRVRTAAHSSKSELVYVDDILEALDGDQ